MEITILEFKEQYLPELREQFHAAVGKSIIENRQSIIEKLEKQIETFIHFVGTYQKSVPVKMGEMQIALLYTSVCMGEPQICISAYGKKQILGEEILNIKYRADWLFTEWFSYQKAIEAKVHELCAENYIRKSAIKMMMNESISYLIYCLYAVTKYQFAEFDKKNGYTDLALTENFRLTVGGYRDWSRTLYQRRGEIDLFMREQGVPLTYSVFQGAVYNKKKFTHLELSHTRFYECEFIHCEFEDVNFRDAIFDNCRMYHCIFSEVDFYGATFKQSTLKKNHAKKIHWQYEADFKELEDIYKNVDFLECINDGTIFEENV